MFDYESNNLMSQLSLYDSNKDINIAGKIKFELSKLTILYFKYYPSYWIIFLSYFCVDAIFSNILPNSITVDAD